MISILGRGAVLLALAACSVGTITGAVAAIRGSANALRITRIAAYVFGGALVLATILMEVALLTHDFWGQSMHLMDSHKSFRPLSVLSYRLNYLLHEFRPFGYHLTNVLLHAATTALVVIFVRHVCRCGGGGGATPAGNRVPLLTGRGNRRMR